MSRVTPIDDTGAARMVAVCDNADTESVAVASATVRMQRETMTLLQQGNHKKGDVLAVARIAGIQGAKKCSDLIPLCHPLMLTSVNVDFRIDADNCCVHVESRCKVWGKAGCEIGARTDVTAAALTIYDMCKAVDRGMEISGVRLLSKSGGQSGDWRRDGQSA